jgi:hypothetical protein
VLKLAEQDSCEPDTNETLPQIEMFHRVATTKRVVKMNDMIEMCATIDSDDEEGDFGAVGADCFGAATGTAVATGTEVATGALDVVGTCPADTGALTGALAPLVGAATGASTGAASGATPGAGGIL